MSKKKYTEPTQVVYKGVRYNVHKKHGCVKLPDEMILEIHHLIKTGTNCKYLKDFFGIGQQSLDRLACRSHIRRSPDQSNITPEGT